MSETTNTFIETIQPAKDIEAEYGNADSATKLAKAIGTIYPDEAQIQANINKGMTEENTWNEAKRVFNLYSSNAKIEAQDNNVTAIKNEIKGHVENLNKYYEYIQFKKAAFKCTKVEYDNATGRIKEMDFSFKSI